MYIISKATFKQARFSASQWPLSKISMFNIYIFLDQNFIIMKWKMVLKVNYVQHGRPRSEMNILLMFIKIILREAYGDNDIIKKIKGPQM